MLALFGNGSFGYGGNRGVGAGAAALDKLEDKDHMFNIRMYFKL